MHCIRAYRNAARDLVSSFLAPWFTHLFVESGGTRSWLDPSSAVVVVTTFETLIALGEAQWRENYDPQRPTQRTNMHMRWTQQIWKHEMMSLWSVARPSDAPHSPQGGYIWYISTKYQRLPSELGHSSTVSLLQSFSILVARVNLFCLHVYKPAKRVMLIRGETLLPLLPNMFIKNWQARGFDFG